MKLWIIIVSAQEEKQTNKQTKKSTDLNHFMWEKELFDTKLEEKKKTKNEIKKRKEKEGD